MTIELKPLKKSSPEFKQMKLLYISAFPKEERAPFRLLTKRMKRENVDFLSIFADGSWAGLAYVVTSDTLAYLFFFAIDDSKRGQGIGSATLTELSKRYGDKSFFLAIEELDEKYPNFAERVDRKAFYERNGLHSLDTKIVEAGVVYDLMGFGDKISPIAYSALMNNYLGKIYSHLVDTHVCSSLRNINNNK